LSNTHLFFSTILFYFLFILHDFNIETLLLIVKHPSFFLYNSILLFIHFAWFHHWFYSTYCQTPFFFSLQSYSTFHSFYMILTLTLFHLLSNTLLFFSTILFYFSLILLDFIVESILLIVKHHLFFSTILIYFSFILRDFIVESILLIIKHPSFFLYNPILLFIYIAWFHCWVYSTYCQTPIFFFSIILFYFSFILRDFIVESILLIIKHPSFFLYNSILLFIHIAWFHCWDYSTYPQTTIFFLYNPILLFIHLFSPKSYSTFHYIVWFYHWDSILLIVKHPSFFSAILFYFSFTLHYFIVGSILLIVKHQFFFNNPILLFIHFA